MSTLATLEAAGLQVCALPDGRLRVSPAERLTEELRALIRENKAAILAELVRQAQAGTEQARGEPTPHLVQAYTGNMSASGTRWIITWPADTIVPTIHGKWHKLPSGEIEAEYTREELELCLACVGKAPRPVYCMDDLETLRRRYRESATELLAELEELPELTEDQQQEADYYRSLLRPVEVAQPQAKAA